MNRESTNSPGFEAWRLVLKLFLPSWNFFNDFGVVTQLEFCLVRAGETESAWQPVHPITTTPGWRRMFFNAQGNLELLEKSLLDRIATVLQECPARVSDDFAHSEGGLMLARIIRARLQEQGVQVTTFRFRLVFIDAANQRETLFVSAALPIMESTR